MCSPATGAKQTLIPHSMGWPNWGLGGVPVQPEGFPRMLWSHLIPAMPQMGRKLKLALPCIGMDALGAGLRELRWDGYEITYGYDVDESLIPILIHLHGGDVNLNIGHRGDLLACNEEEWSRVDFVISGPPCPSFSSIGSNRAPETDPREAIFQKVTKIIISQGRKRCLGFIMEMVPGIAHRSREQNYFERWLAELREQAPMFRIDVWPMNSSDYVPQNRPRLYIVGVLSDLLGDAGIPPPMPCATMRVPLGDVLHKGLLPVDERMLTPQQRHNLSMAKPLLRLRLLQQGRSPLCTPTTGALGRFRPPIACFSVDRDSEKQFGLSIRSDDTVPTLRIGNEMLWLLKYSEAGDVIISRCLHPVERLALQGFAPELARHVSKNTLMRITGNSFTVPVVVAVFRQCLVSIAHRRSPATGAFFVPLLLTRPPSEMASILAKRKRINELRENIAILDAELQWQERQFHNMVGYKFPRS